MTIGDFSALLLALATTVSLIYISRQVNVTRKQTKGEFLLALDDQFEKTNSITLRLVNEPTFKPTSDDWMDIFRLMSVFERINIMVEDDILDAALVDRLYGFRLINLIANDDVFARVQASGADWQDFIDLCYAVADHRMQMVPTDERDQAFSERVHQLSKQTRSLKNPFSTQAL